MCKQRISTKIYECGDRVTEQVSFDACGDLTKEGHQVETDVMGSSRVKGLKYLINLGIKSI